MQLSKSGARSPGRRGYGKLISTQSVGRSRVNTIRGPERDRTADLLNANQALSQLSYRPERGRGILVERFAIQRTMFAVVPRSASPIPASLGINFRPPSRAKIGGPKWNCTTDPRVISTVLC